MRRRYVFARMLSMLYLFFLFFMAAVSCGDEIPRHTGPEPMRAPRGGPARSLPAADSEPAGVLGDVDSSSSKPVISERPPADPEIERALNLIGASGLRFIDSRSDPNERPSEYTAEQFASMLRTKWDWLGYDLTTIEPWLDEIATRSFKTNLPYLVVLADGTSHEFRPWLDQQLRAAPPADER
jgi:hypothetical protein